MTESGFIVTTVFILGAVVGSFLNVCIVRMPLEKSIVYPSSHCPHCKNPIAWYCNIPLLSYVFLKGKCFTCGKTISFRYFFVELLTSLTFVGFYIHFHLSLLLTAYLVMVCGFIVATFVDFEHRIIPDEISLGGTMAGLLLSGCIPAMHEIDRAVYPGWQAHAVSIGQSLLGALVGGGSIYLMGLIGDSIFKKESMGGGDVKLMAMIGAFLGWKYAVLSFFIAPLFGAVYGIVEKVRTKDSAIAYGPFLILGALISLFWGKILIRWILGGYGLYDLP